MNILKANRVLLFFIIFCFLNILLYGEIISFHNIIPFNHLNYNVNSYHFVGDPNKDGKRFSLFSSLAQFDAQWYLKIGDQGYPKKILHHTESSYAFFPFYPLLLFLGQKIFDSLLISAFTITNILIILNFFSLYYVISKLYSEELALKTIFLLFLFPFSIFFRSYFAEGIQLFLLTWFAYFWITKKYFQASIFLAFLDITKGSLLLINLFFLYSAWEYLKRESVMTRLVNWITIAICISIPFFIWCVYNFFQTGDPLYFYHVLSEWGYILPTPLYFFYNIIYILIAPLLQFHAFHSSILELLTFLLTFLLLIKSKEFLKYELWIISFLLCATPFITKDLMSFSRYQTVSFPLFLYLSWRLKGKIYLVTVVGFAAILAITAIFFVNWYWVG